MVELQQYWQAVHRRIYSECVENDEHGNSRLHVSIECKLQQSLPLMVDVVPRMKLHENGSYREVLQTIVRCFFYLIETIRRESEERETRSYYQLSFQ